MFILISSITNNWILKIKCHHSIREKDLFSQGILNNCKECFSNIHKLNSGHQIQVHVLYTMRVFDIYVMVFIFFFRSDFGKTDYWNWKNMSQLRCYNNILCEKSHKSLYGLFCKRNSHLNPKPLEQGQEETHQGVNHIYKGKKTNRFNIKLQFNTQHNIISL